ncbi:MAG: Low affinity potassium transport system protein kup [Gemmatimonadetes bacterium]|jgi:KUP system potassium uptake protein|nr:Low affinity potassium transport system protein kup [Gemmatimonadota bacterium]
MSASPSSTAPAAPASVAPGLAAAGQGDDRHAGAADPTGRRLAALTLGALGVVYGDIGTSPLYTMKEAFGAEHGLAPSAANVYGILSLVFWAIMLVVVLKYLVFILRADNRGEGGVLALLALVQQRQQRTTDGRRRAALVILGVFGTALLYGDGIITPAISVLGAMEGLRIITPALDRVVLAGTLVILLALFLAQRAGTARVGRAFGPITLVWFAVIGTLGLLEIVRAPAVLAAANPVHAARFLYLHGFMGFAALGAVFLAVTGAEALYADMGHFGRRPIRLAFLVLVLPALLLNYFGQGALLLRMPSAVENPFYLLAPRWFLYPLLLVSTLAAIVASQALISGVFSLAQQAVQLGFSPRLTIVHTSREQSGQIYVPEINVALMVGTLLIVIGFRSSSALGAAYGIAVTGTMAITTILFAVVARTRWEWPLPRVLALTSFFLALDLAFLGANALKIARGGWVPLAIALGVVTLMTTWKAGRSLLTGIMRGASLPLDLLLDEIGRRPPHRVSGTAVFLTSTADGAPVVLMHHLKHNKALHEQVVLLSVVVADVPSVDEAGRVEVTAMAHGFFRVRASYGFMESPNVPEVLALAESSGLRARPMETSYYLGRERLIPTGTAPMARWRKRLFILMSRNARSAAEYFGLPSNRVVEMGAQIEL